MQISQAHRKEKRRKEEKVKKLKGDADRNNWSDEAKLVSVESAQWLYGLTGNRESFLSFFLQGSRIIHYSC